jgi:3-deoxy-D-manno-octulosonic-acid transferase
MSIIVDRSMLDEWSHGAFRAGRLSGGRDVDHPFVGGYLTYRAAKGKEDRTRRLERSGYASADRPAGPLVWFHAASVGEMNAVIPLIREIRRRDIHVILTTGTVTSAKLAADRVGTEVIHQYVPLDLKPAVSRFLDYWQPDCAMIAESEIWPATVLELGRRRIPQILVNARMSDRSFARWTRRQSLAEALFENLALGHRPVGCRCRALPRSRCPPGA